MSTATEKGESLSAKQIVVFSLIGLGTLAFLARDLWWPSSDARQSASPGIAAPATGTAQERQGRYAAHQFHYVVKDGVAVATFTPFLPRDDAKVVGAIEAVVRAAFGASIDTGSAALSGQEIAVRAGSTTFYAMLVKEDTGQVHSIRIRQ